MTEANPRFPFTLGGAFFRLKWVTLGVDAVLLTASIVCAAVYVPSHGAISGLCGWTLAIIFSEFNSLIARILDHYGVKGAQYTIGLMLMWGMKLLVAIGVGTLMLSYVPLHMKAFLIVLVAVVAVITVKNVIITAKARVL
ncbi:hypothetical protein ACFQY8_00085 [Alloscardovia venturai]|uniref:ATP synthase subunit I n=1 Tax=Alloscardovia venturai TaxID=1769421 RepID=A0ABW2Y1N0_9BIFI